jgi:hypothetical protein
MKFGNDHIFDMANFDETSRWMGWSENEFSHSLALEVNAGWRCRFVREGFWFFIVVVPACLSLRR